MSQSNEHMFFGVHVIGELYGVDAKMLNNKELLESVLKEGIKLSGATLCSLQTKVFDPSGITSLALLSESHASFHTYPDYNALFFDAFTCGTDCQPQKIADHMIEILKPKRHTLKTIKRGEEPEAAKVIKLNKKEDELKKIS